MTERWRQPLRYPLTADLAGVLEAARHDRAPARGTGAVTVGSIGAAAARAVSGLIGRLLVPRSRRSVAGSSVRIRSV
jgi:hypothetical protein